MFGLYYVCSRGCFFKQKTAYELRISDWSSDVCSSDLAARVPIAIAGVVIAAVLLQRSRRLIAASRRLPAPNEAQKKANRSIWIKFWINFVFEIVLLNIAITLL